MLVTLSEILKDAEERKYGVGLFNMLNLEMARGIIEAAEEERSPLILGVAEVHLPLIPFEYAALIMNDIAKKASVPVCLHFDHGVSFERCMEALELGYSSIMFDGSALSFEENIKATAAAVKAAHAVGATVEGEIGCVGQAASSDNEHTDMYTLPEDAKRFGVTDKQVVRLETYTDRPLVFGDVVVRVNSDFQTRVHLDFDEANACGFRDGDLGRILL